MECEAADSATRRGKKESRHLFSQLDHAHCRATTKVSRHRIALPLRWSFNAYRCWTLRKKLVFKLRFSDRYFASQELRRVLAGGWLCPSMLRAHEEQHSEDKYLHCLIIIQRSYS